MAASTTVASPLLALPKDESEASYELLLFNAAGTHLLLQQERNITSLPSVVIPRFTRPAETITSWLRTSWNMKAVLLWSRQLDTELRNRYFAVLEVIKSPGLPIAALDWVPTDYALARIASPRASLIRDAQAKALEVSADNDLEPFSRLGWIYRLKDWINETVRPAQTEIGDFSQFNGSERFSLVRFETKPGPLWFKAVGAPNLHEFPITVLLSKLFPTYLPEVLASHPTLNGWLMNSVGKLTLFDCPKIETWMNAVQQLAELQARSLGRTQELLQAGCHDLRISTLKSFVSPFFDVMAELMSEQTKPCPPPLTPPELNDLASNIQEALGTMAELGCGESLGHVDFNPGNILVNGERSVFVDWVEAYVGPPFLTLEFFLEHLRNGCPSLADQEDRIRTAYLKPWSSLMPREDMRTVLALAPLVAPFAYAISGNAWRDPERLRNERIKSTLRSLGRRMKRESESILSKRKARSVLVG